MLLRSLIVASFAFGNLAAGLPAPSPGPLPLPADVVSSSEPNEFGAYVNPNPKNICEGDELDMLTLCASEVLAKLDECKPDDLACECCALQSMKRDCYGLCPNTQSGNFLAVLYDDCETMNDVNACNLPFKKHDTHVAKFLRPNSRVPVEDKEPDFVLQSTITNTSNETKPGVISHFAYTEKVVNSTELESGVNYTNISKVTGEEESAAATMNLMSASKLVFILAATVAASYFI